MGRGQRVGLFGGSGVGKSTLLGQIASHASADVNVVVLVGERNREVAPFVKYVLGPSGMAKSAVVVATSNESPLARVRAADAALTMADWFRRQGSNVLLILDSITRFCHGSTRFGAHVR
jgi:flagellum-specific ATP synthase